VLDFDLGEADSTQVCWKLASRQIPFFHSGRLYSAFGRAVRSGSAETDNAWFD
jgi:hypothetical protein